MAKMRNVWQVSESIEVLLKNWNVISVKHPCGALHQDFLSLWNSFLPSVKIAIKRQWLTLNDRACSLSNSPKFLKKVEKKGNSNVPRFQYKVTVLFSPKIKNVSLILCQSSAHFQNKLLTKLFRASLLNYIKHSF